MFDVLAAAKYALWCLSTGLAFAGAWFFRFTRDDPGRPGHLTLTPPGRIAFPLALVAFVSALGLQVMQDRAAADKADAARRAQADQAATIRTMSTQLDDLGKAIAKLLETPAVAQQVTAPGPEGEQLRALTATPSVRRHIAPSTLQRLSRLGLDEAVIKKTTPR